MGALYFTFAPKFPLNGVFPAAKGKKFYGKKKIFWRENLGGIVPTFPLPGRYWSRTVLLITTQCSIQLSDMALASINKAAVIYMV